MLTHSSLAPCYQWSFRPLITVVAVICTFFIIGPAYSYAQGPTQSQQVKSLLSQMDGYWKSVTPLTVEYGTTVIWNKQLVAEFEEHRQSPAFFPNASGPLDRGVRGQWLHTGVEVADRQKDVFPTMLSHPAIVIADAWHRVSLFDGKQYVQMVVQDNSEVPVIATVLPKAGDAASSLRAVTAKPGSDLLLLSPDGSTWTDFLSRIPTLLLSPGKWRELNCLVLSWEWQVGEEKFLRSVFVVPSRSFMVTREVNRKIGSEVLWETEVKDLKQVKDRWLPVEVQRTLYTRPQEYAGRHLPLTTTTSKIEQIKVAEPVVEEAFKFDPDKLPKGSEVNHLYGTFFVGVEISESDILKLAGSLRQYVAGQVTAAEVTRGLPRSKQASFSRDCGPYSLLVVCHALGVSGTLPELSKLAGTDAAGITSVSGIVAALRAKGLNVGAYEMEWDDLRQAPLPAILHFNPEHFAVLLKVEGEVAIIYDPPAQVRAVPVEFLKKQWSKHAIIVKPHSTAPLLPRVKPIDAR